MIKKKHIQDKSQFFKSQNNQTTFKENLKIINGEIHS